jgi:hypothetical protein
MSLLKTITKDKKSLVITAIIVVVGIMIFKKVFKTPPQLIKSNTKRVLSDGVILSTPDTKFNGYNLVIIFGGMYYATPEWMYKQIPTEGFYKNIVVIAPYTMSFEKAKVIYETALKAYTIKSTSVMGFSAGSLQVQNNYSPKWEIAGLIDPSTKSQYLELPFSDNVKMIYNNANWGGNLAPIGTVQAKLDTIIKKKGGFAEKVNISHKSIPKYFFEKFLN